MIWALVSYSGGSIIESRPSDILSWGFPRISLIVSRWILESFITTDDYFHLHHYRITDVIALYFSLFQKRNLNIGTWTDIALHCLCDEWTTHVSLARNKSTIVHRFFRLMPWVLPQRGGKSHGSIKWKWFRIILGGHTTLMTVLIKSSELRHEAALQYCKIRMGTKAAYSRKIEY
jgi:hypothetical protein